MNRLTAGSELAPFWNHERQLFPAGPVPVTVSSS